MRAVPPYPSGASARVASLVGDGAQAARPAQAGSFEPTRLNDTYTKALRRSSPHLSGHNSRYALTQTSLK
eukprot:7506140-Pyramimonas_sp.AAC.1